MTDEIRENPWCLTLTEDMMDERDFVAAVYRKLYNNQVRYNHPTP